MSDVAVSNVGWVIVVLAIMAVVWQRLRANYLAWRYEKRIELRQKAAERLEARRHANAARL